MCMRVFWYMARAKLYKPMNLLIGMVMIMCADMVMHFHVLSCAFMRLHDGSESREVEGFSQNSIRTATCKVIDIAIESVSCNT